MGSVIKKKGIVIFIFIVAIALALLLGYFFGTSSKEDEGMPIGKNDSKGIAVVNMDTGVMEGENVKEYALQILPYCGVDYVITGLSDAREGIKDGKYDAYVIIPETFSRSVDSINTNPESISLPYTVSEKLSETETEKTNRNVEKLRTGLNTSLTQVYMSNLLSGLHEAQNAADKIISNDKKDAEKLNGVDAGSLVALVEVPELKETTNDVAALDLTQQYADQDQLISDLDSKYAQYLQTVQSNISGSQTGIVTTSQSMTTAMNLLNSANSSLTDQSAPGTAAAIYQTNTTQYQTNVKGYLNTIEYYEKKMAAYNTYIASYNSNKTGNVKTFNQYVAGVDANAPKYDADTRTNIESNVTNIITEGNTMRTTLSGQYTTATNALTLVQSQVNILSSSLGNYDVTGNLDSNGINSTVQGLKENTKDIESSVSDYSAKQEGYVADAVKSAGEYVSSMQKSVSDAESKTTKKVSDGLAAAKASRNASSKENITVMGSLPGILGYTRQGELENKDAYEFMASPLALEGNTDADTTIADNKAKDTNVFGKWLKPILWLLLAVLIILLVILMVKTFRSNGGRETAQDTYWE